MNYCKLLTILLVIAISLIGFSQFELNGGVLAFPGVNFMAGGGVNPVVHDVLALNFSVQVAVGGFEIENKADLFHYLIMPGVETMFYPMAPLLGEYYGPYGSVGGGYVHAKVDALVEGEGHKEFTEHGFFFKFVVGVDINPEYPGFFVEGGRFCVLGIEEGAYGYFLLSCGVRM